MPILERANGSIHYEAINLVPEWVPDPPAILFHHGLGTTSGIWSEWLPPLSDRFRLIRFDLRGFGRSCVPPAGFPWSLEILAEDTLAVAEAAGASRFHFVGESLGGIMGYYLAIHRPEVLLTMTSCSASHRGSRIEGGIDTWGDLVATKGMAGWSKMMMDSRFPPRSISQAAWDWFDREQAASPAHANLEASRMLRRMDLAGDLGRIRTPTLLIVGEASPFVPVAMMREIRDLIPGAELQVVTGARHGVVFSHAQACAALLRDFIARHPVL